MIPYNLQNYQPGSKPDDPIPDALKQRAKAQGCEFISKDGQRGYKWLFGDMLVSYAPEFAALGPVT